VGFLDTLSRIGSSTGRPDRICEELGWPIDYRQGNIIGLYFHGDRITPKRLVMVAFDPEVEIITFSCTCQGEFRRLPDDLLPALMMRNAEVTFGGWVAGLDAGSISLKVHYTALAAGVDAQSFKMICSMMVKEVAEVEGALRGKGLI
jgi:hypothetical protein